MPPVRVRPRTQSGVGSRTPAAARHGLHSIDFLIGSPHAPHLADLLPSSGLGTAITFRRCEGVGEQSKKDHRMKDFTPMKESGGTRTNVQLHWFDPSEKLSEKSKSELLSPSSGYLNHEDTKDTKLGRKRASIAVNQWVQYHPHRISSTSRPLCLRGSFSPKNLSDPILRQPLRADFGAGRKSKPRLGFANNNLQS